MKSKSPRESCTLSRHGFKIHFDIKRKSALQVNQCLIELDNKEPTILKHST